ncbi:MAG TPA: hypothetical protein DCL73_05970 [Treponema sp.]|nr:hypothetical protein [Treponema sp.]
MKKLIGLPVLALWALLTAGCATTVPVTVTRPGELDLRGAKSISVLPFRLSTAKDERGSSSKGTTIIIDIGRFFDSLAGDNSEERRAANFLTDQLTQKLTNSQYVQLVNSSAVQSALENGTAVPADAYLTGGFTLFDSHMETTHRTETDSAGNEYNAAYYKKTVSASITYQIIDTKTNQIIAYKSTDVTNSSDEKKDNRQLPKDFDIIRPDLERLSDQIMKELQPYEERMYISLLSDKTKDPDMKIADEMAKKGLIKQSEEKFMSIYTQRNLFVAGYNAAKLLQAQGELYKARDMMERLVNKFGDKRAMTALSNIDYEIAQSEKLQRQTTN